jgi:Iron-containing redox enzyme
MKMLSQAGDLTNGARGMTTSVFGSPSFETSIQDRIEAAIDAVINSLPNPKYLSADRQRGIIRRYTAVLEGNFIYWMTGAYLGVKSEEARSIILDNLREEVRDCHPGMLRRFALAAHAIPTDCDALVLQRDLMNVRLFVGRLTGIPSLIMMAFFEGFIQKFMGFLAELAVAQGSTELQYTDVHGVCDVGHTQELFRAVASELALQPPTSGSNLFAGVNLLCALLQAIVHGPADKGDAFEYRAGTRTA